ncbi:hypothetical protein [Streptococcus ruminantium]|uniref:hypothetical protein n=1 Tax=Streptococcus ruminantium TaxID=1917441 RepID=UPI001D149927|nr:hypothetical protein [Streptococcus ruminantium]BDD40155.1 hypothetical protein GUT184_04190 [Streptococcus ruminantium]
MTMTSDIKLTYIDDKLDPLLVEYLFTLGEEEQIFKYDEYAFDSSQDSYLSLLENSDITSSDIIIVDSKLFENKSANSQSKFTGQELKLIFATANPFIQVIVITQNNNLAKYGVIKKFATTRGSSGREQEEANDYYNDVLKKELKASIKKIKEIRNTGQLLSENSSSYEKTLVVEKVNNLIKKVPSYKELTDEKIDELIDLIKLDLEGDHD